MAPTRLRFGKMKVEKEHVIAGDTPLLFVARTGLNTRISWPWRIQRRKISRVFKFWWQRSLTGRVFHLLEGAVQVQSEANNTAERSEWFCIVGWWTCVSSSCRWLVLLFVSLRFSKIDRVRVSVHRCGAAYLTSTQALTQKRRKWDVPHDFLEILSNVWNCILKLNVCCQNFSKFQF